MSEITKPTDINTYRALSGKLIENPLLGGWKPRQGYQCVWTRYNIFKKPGIEEDFLDVENIQYAADSGFLPVNPIRYPELALHFKKCKINGEYKDYYIAYGGLILLERPDLKEHKPNSIPHNLTQLIEPMFQPLVLEDGTDTLV